MAPKPEQFGPFAIVRELGRGAMGVVFHARRADLDRDVALKVIAADPSRTDLLARFRREAQAAARLGDHPNIVGVFDMGITEPAASPDGVGRAWFSMELVPGAPLDRLIQAGDLDHRQAARLIAQVARAVDYAHDQGIIHRDLKPANILVTPEGVARVTDFGLVRLQDVAGDLTRITTSDLLVGTPAYMAPEQVAGGPIDGRVDVFALGATLYEALVGHPPYIGESVYSVLSKLLSSDPPPLRPLDPSVPPDLEAIVLRALRRDCDERYPTAAAFADDLEAWLEGRPVAVRRSGTLARLGKGVRRHRGAVAVGAVAVIVLSAAAGVWWGLRVRGAQGADDLVAAAQQAAAGDARYRTAQAWRALSHGTQQAMRVLENRWNGVPVPADELAAALGAVRTTAAAVATAHPGTVLPDAWLRLAEMQAALSWDLGPLEAVVRSADADPLPGLLLARAHLQRWAAEFELPEVTIGRLEVTVTRLSESAAQRDRREAAAALLARLHERPDLLEAADVQAELELLRATTRLAADPTRETAAAVGPVLRALMDRPELAGSATRLFGLACFLAGEPEAAALTWERLAEERGWIETLDKACMARLVRAGEQFGQGHLAEARAEYAAVERNAARVVAAMPDEPTGYQRRASAHEGLGSILAREGADPEAEFAQALAAAEAASRLGEGPHLAYVQWIELLFAASHYDHAFGRDALPRLEEVFRIADGWRAVDSGEAVDVAALNARGVAGTDIARLRLQRGEPGGATLTQAIADLTAAQAIHPHDASVQVHLARALRQRADLARTQGLDPLEDMTRALALHRGALELEPTSMAMQVDLADALSVMGRMVQRRGEDPDPYLDEALAIVEPMAAASGLPEVLAVQASLLVGRGEVQLARGEDPVASCNGALAVLDRLDAALRGRQDFESARRRANALWLRGRWEAGVGVDPTASYRGAAEHYGRAVTGAAGDLEARADRALVHLALGDWAMDNGRDGTPDYERAIADLGAAMLQAPTNASLLHSRGIAWRSVAKAAFQRGRKPGPAFERAQADLNRAVTLDATAPEIYNDRGLLFRLWAEVRQAAGEPAVLQLNLAIRDFDQALSLAPDLRAALNNRGNAYGAVAQEEDRRENDPRPWLQLGIADFDRLLALSPDDVGARNNRALLHQEAGDAERNYQGDPEPHYALAVADYAAVLQRNPRSAAAYTNRGVVHVSRGQVAEERGADPLPHYRAAVADHSAALAIAPGDPGTLVNRALARRQLALAGAADPATATAAREGALADLEAAAAANPRLWQVHAMRGRVLADLGRRAEALAAYDAALALFPGQRAVLAWRAELTEDGR